MKARAILFDLDGTLVDSVGDIACAVNAALEAHGQSSHTIGAYRNMVGSGLANLVAKALPQEAGDDLKKRVLQTTLEEYAKCYDRHTVVYDGIAPTLDALQTLEVPLAILSNKMDEFTKKIAATILQKWHFQAVYGAREGVPKKPDPAAALEIANELSVSPRDFLFIGDSGVDVKTALACGMQPLGVSWGYRTVAELEETGARKILNRPEELIEFLTGN